MTLKDRVPRPHKREAPPTPDEGESGLSHWRLDTSAVPPAHVARRVFQPLQTFFTGHVATWSSPARPFPAAAQSAQ